MQDPPGLEVRDDLLDHVADLVDLGVEFFLPVEQCPVGGLSDRGEHAVADVALVADPPGGVYRDQDA